jgi:hypothetical protein
MFFTERFQNSSRLMPRSCPAVRFWPMNVAPALPVSASIQSTGGGRLS